MGIEDGLDFNSLERNNYPQEDFMGLTHNEMDALLYQPFDEKSPVRLKEQIADDVLDKIPIFRITEALFEIIRQEGPIKLTKTGALPRKIVTELYDLGYVKDFLIENGYRSLLKQDDWNILSSIKVTIEISFMVRKAKGVLNLTKKTQAIMAQNDRSGLFHLFFKAYTSEFNWGYNDSYTPFPFSQIGWAYSIYLLSMFGEKKEITDFYAEKYLTAFPFMLECFSENLYVPREIQAFGCYNTRLVDRFLDWFGLISITEKPEIFSNEETKIMKSLIFDRVFDVDEV
ncbi:MAG: hypothetical protein J5I59_09655 [Saprospiraceae bacterium]|nr:hypothetical protein [Saprospiraceae bacterium]